MKTDNELDNVPIVKIDFFRSLEEDLKRVNKDMMFSSHTLQKILHIIMGMLMDHKTLNCYAKLNSNIINMLHKNEELASLIGELSRNLDTLIYETKVNIIPE